MKIAICDDEPLELTRISSLMEEYRFEKKAGFIYKTFSGALELLEVMRREPFDLLLLDVIMPGINGMQVAHEIRAYDKHIKIVFLTSSPEYAVESYSVNAYNYLLKPIKKGTLFPMLDKLFDSMQRKDDYLAVKCKTGIVRISYTRLSYVEILGKILSFHMSDGVVYETAASLSEFEAAILSRPEFLRVHRSFLVNLWQMRELSIQHFITLGGMAVPVSRRLYTQVRDAYMKSLFTKKGEH